MSSRLPCSRCGAVRDVEIVEREEKVTIKAREVPFAARFTRCLTCGNEFEAPGQRDANLAAAREVYTRLYESPSPEELVALRSRYGASQKAFGAILGFGELTMNSYEKGSPPDPTNRLLLKLAADPLTFKAMYDINSSKIGAIQRRRIEESEGFQAALRWSGLGALSPNLTQLQREKIEACAERYDRTIPEQIAVYVGPASFQDYSRLYVEARWSEEEAAELPSAIGPAPPRERRDERRHQRSANAFPPCHRAARYQAYALAFRGSRFYATSRKRTQARMEAVLRQWRPARSDA